MDIVFKGNDFYEILVGKSFLSISIVYVEIIME